MTMKMDEELKKLSWFLEGPFITMVPTPTAGIKSDQEMVDYLNENKLTIISFDVVSNLKKVLDAKEKEWEEERGEMKKETKKLQLKKAVCMANQTKLVECLRKLGELTGFKESFGSEESKCVLVGHSVLDRFYEHVKSEFEKGSAHSSPPSPPASSTASGFKWRRSEEMPKMPKMKRARKAVIYSSDEDEDEGQDVAGPSQPVNVIKRKTDEGQDVAGPSQPVNVIKRKTDEGQDVAGPSQPVNVIKRKTDGVSPKPESGSSKKLSSSSSLISTSSESKSSTKWRCTRCDGRCESKQEYKDHQKICRLIAGQLKDHGGPYTGLGGKTSQHKRVPIGEEGVTIEMEFLGDDGGEDTVLVGEALPKSVNCRVCGEGFGNVAVLNFHIKKKHSG